MMYPFMTLDDGAEIVHSETKIIDGKECVKVYIEKPDEKDCFHYATCYLPEYKWENIYGFNETEINKYKDVIETTSHLIMEFAKQGGFENASNF